MRVALFVLLAGCAARPAAIQYVGASADVKRDVEEGRRRVTSFFGADYVRPFKVQVFTDRAAFTAHMRVVFKDPTVESACWMVGVGTGDGLALLDPARWATEACDHDGRDARHVANLVTHELVHVYHAQMNPRLDSETDRFEPLAWFVEGLATYASGQLEERKLAADAPAPESLATAYSGKHRYGVSGSLVAHIDYRCNLSGAL
jgi:hypothetical protein